MISMYDFLSFRSELKIKELNNTCHLDSNNIWRRRFVEQLLWVVLIPAVVHIQPIIQQMIYFSYLFEHCFPTQLGTTCSSRQIILTHSVNKEQPVQLARGKISRNLNYHVCHLYLKTFVEFVQDYELRYSATYPDNPTV